MEQEPACGMRLPVTRTAAESMTQKFSERRAEAAVGRSAMRAAQNSASATKFSIEIRGCEKIKRVRRAFFRPQSSRNRHGRCPETRARSAFPGGLVKPLNSHPNMARSKFNQHAKTSYRNPTYVLARQCIHRVVHNRCGQPCGFFPAQCRKKFRRE